MTASFDGPRDPLLEQILDAMPERVSRYRADDHVVLYCNRAWAQGHGSTPEQLVGRPLDELLTAPELAGMRSQLARLSEQTPVLTDTEARRAPEAPELWIEWIDRYIPGPEGAEVLSIGRDVTARHEAQIGLEASERRFRLAMRDAPIGMEIIGLDDRLIEVNPAFCAFLGRSEDDLIGRTWQELTHPDDLETDRAQVTALYAGECPSYTAEKRYLHADGSTRWGLQTGIYIRDTQGQPLYGLAQVVDVTARRLAEEHAETSETLLRLAGAMARLGGWEWDLDTDQLRWSEQISLSLGYPIGQEPGFSEVMQLYAPDDRLRLQAAIDECLASGSPWDLELEVTTAQGEQLCVRSVGEAAPGDDGASRMRGAFQDITVQKESERETRWLAEQLTTTLDSIDDGFYSLDHDWRFTYISARGAQILDRDPDELIGLDLWETFPHLKQTDVYAGANRALEEGEPVKLDRYFDERFNTWFELDVYPTSRGVVVYFRDVTEQTEREQVLRRAVQAEQDAADRLRALDRAKNAFLSAVSHELRTPLTVVHGMATSLVRLRGVLTDPVREQIEDSLAEHTDKLRTLLNDLLDVDRLARGALSAERVRCDVASVMRDVVANSDQRARVSFEGPSSLVCNADPVQIERIVSNLLDNAGKYAPDGLVTLRLSDFEPAGFRLDAIDQGPGVPAEELERVFEPFHRIDDNHPRPGTGVGLALVADFARVHGGRAWAENTGAGGGAHFVVAIPGQDPPA